ncbi:protein Mpv17 [Nematocida ausubeli]|nr:protein Mpv17 [Nematocida ausubeli]
MKINKRGVIEERRKQKKATVKDYILQGGSTALILAVSDILGQLVLGGITSYVQTPLLMGFYGFMTGNLSFLMYTRMDSYSSERFDRIKGLSAIRIKIALYKMLFDQLVWSPFGTFMFIFVASLVDSSDFSIKKVLRDYFRILFDSYKIWPILQMINFLFVPLEMRVVFISMASLLWNTYVKIARQG